MNAIQVKQCSSCKITFYCGASVPEDSCWCHDFPPIFDFSEGGDCLCSSCLKNNCSIKIEDYLNTITPVTALENTTKNLPKTNNLIEDLDYYLENGNYVFKAWFHLKRGYYCGNGCRHCPY